MSERAVICNVGDQEWTLMRTHGFYRIPKPAAGQKFALLIVADRTDVIDNGDNHRLEVPIHARKIAEDLVADLGDFGVFVCTGETPAAEEIDRAERRLVEVAKRLVFEGDQEWARSHNYREISDLHRRAVKRLGPEREWAYEPTEMTACPACGERIRPGVAVCRHCNAILDERKARQFGLTESTAAAQARRRPAPAHARQ